MTPLYTSLLGLVLYRYEPSVPVRLLFLSGWPALLSCLELRFSTTNTAARISNTGMLLAVTGFLHRFSLYLEIDLALESSQMPSVLLLPPPPPPPPPPITL